MQCNKEMRMSFTKPEGQMPIMLATYSTCRIAITKTILMTKEIKY